MCVKQRGRERGLSATFMFGSSAFDLRAVDFLGSNCGVSRIFVEEEVSRIVSAVALRSFGD